MSTVNANFETEFDIDEERLLLGIENRDRVNRYVVTQDSVGKTSFSTYLHRVQYGTYQGKEACLVALDHHFRFKSKHMSRFTSASIEITFEHTQDSSNPKQRSADPMTDPKILNFAPKQVYGIVRTVDQKKHWQMEVPLMFQHPIGVSAGITATAGGEESLHEENRMEIHGIYFQDDEHDEGANGVCWDLQENQSQADGIFRSFRSAIIVEHPASQAMWLRVVVKPVVKFSLDPRRLITKEDPLSRLLQKNDEPVLLDGKTPLAGQLTIECNEFSSTDYPWAKVVHMPKEYMSQMMASANEADTTTETNEPANTASS